MESNDLDKNSFYTQKSSDKNWVRVESTPKTGKVTFTLNHFNKLDIMNSFAMLSHGGGVIPTLFANYK